MMLSPSRSIRSSGGLGRRISMFVCMLVSALVLSGCASNPQNPDDPFEDYNRAMFKINQRVDKYTFRPLARVYDTVTPRPVKIGVGNFFGNLGDLWIGANNMLQGKFADGVSDWMRFAFNTTWGIGGLLDIASEAGLPKHDEDFGQTLAVWGVGEGPFVVLPFFGPRTTRDAWALPVDLQFDQVWGVDHVRTRNSMTALRITHNRAALLGVEKTLAHGSLDRYTFARDFYLQQRRFKVSDGQVSMEYEDYDEYDDEVPGAPAAGEAAKDVVAPEN